MKRSLLKTLLVAAGVAGCALALPSVSEVSAGETTTISFASLAPQGSSWDQVFRAWGNSLKQQTGGAVQFKYFPNGSMGEERATITKMKQGSLDAAGLTSIGLSQIAHSLSILQMQGVVKNYKQLNHVREQLAPDFEAMFQKEGYHLLGWGDAGFARIFSKRPILKPEDYKTVRPWVPAEDATLPEFMKIVGANGVPLGIMEAAHALSTGMIDTVVVSAIAAVALQWANSVTHVSKEANAAIVGATLMREDLFKSLSPENQKILLDTGKKAHAALIARVQKDDANAYTMLVKRGMTEFDPMGSPAQKEAWGKVGDELTKRLTGRLWSKEFLEKVRKVAASTPE